MRHSKKISCNVIKLSLFIVLLIGSINGSTFGQTDDDPNNFTELFNGEDLTGWDGDSSFWKVDNGVLIGESTFDNRPDANTFLIWEDLVSNFEITFEYRFVLNDQFQWGNSGLQLRSVRIVDEEYPDHKYIVRGYQADFATHGTWTGTFYEERGRGPLAERGIIMYQCSEEQETLRFADTDLLEEIFSHTDWNKYRVYANGNTFRSWINGQLMNQFVDKSPEFRNEGILAFQLHSGAPMRIELRNIRMRSLD